MLPARSTAATLKVWLPLASAFAGWNGEVHAAHRPVSTRQTKVPRSAAGERVNLKVGLVECVGDDGDDVIEVFGATVSTEKA